VFDVKKAGFFQARLKLLFSRSHSIMCLMLCPVDPLILVSVIFVNKIIDDCS